MTQQRTYRDRAEYIKAAVAKRRKKIKAMAVAYLGRICQLCGYARSVEALDFHHLDASKKAFGLSQDGLTRAWRRVQAELSKCVLLCANCHREVHAGVTAAPRRNVRMKTGRIRGSPERVIPSRALAGNGAREGVETSK